MSELGDLTEFLKEGSGSGVSNLDWLSVDEQAYRELDTLPKQNLDVVPDLEAQWSHEDRTPSVYFVPNRDMAGYPKDPRVPQAPTTMGDLSQVHGPLQMVVTAARHALMQSDDLRRWQSALLSRFDKNVLAHARTALAGVLSERGLLGRFYVDAADFPTCAKSAAASEFVRRFAAEAKYVKAKEACKDCSKRVLMGNAQHCSVFHKQIVPELPLTHEAAAKVEAEQATRGATARAPEGASPADRIKTAYLNVPVGRTLKGDFTGQSNTGAIIPAERLLRKTANVAQQEQDLKAHKASPIVGMLRRELLKGRTVEEIAKGLKLAFDPRDLKEAAPYWLPLYKEAGLYGTIYSTQDSFDDCRVGADFLSKHHSSVRGIVAGSKCENCLFSKASRCMLYGRKLVGKAEDLYTETTVAAVLDEHKMAGRISSTLAQKSWGPTPKEALRNIHKTAHLEKAATLQPSNRMDLYQGFYGSQNGHQLTEVTRRQIVKKAHRLLNEGLYGEELERMMQASFDPRDLAAAAADYQKAASEQGLQGIYFINPTAYDDYGNGCKEAQRLHRSRHAVEYVKAADKCATCVHHTRPGYCSVLNKKLAVEIPYQDKAAQQQAMLTSGKSTDIDYGSLVNNGLSMMQEFQLQGGALAVDVNPVNSLDASLLFGSNEVDLSKL
jgi:hypothetical protein